MIIVLNSQRGIQDTWFQFFSHAEGLPCIQLSTILFFRKKNYLIVICYPFSLMLNDPVPHAIFFPSCKGLA